MGGNGFDLAQLVELAHEDRELVAGEPRDDIGRAHRRAQALGEFDQHRVAGRMAEVVVDRLEMVDVEKQHRDAETLLARFRECLLESLEEQRPVRQSRENVVFGPASKLRLDGLALGDVARRDRDPIAELDRLMGDPCRRHAGRAEFLGRRLSGRHDETITLDQECRMQRGHHFLQRLADDFFACAASQHFAARILVFDSEIDDIAFRVAHGAHDEARVEARFGGGLELL